MSLSAQTTTDVLKIGRAAVAVAVLLLILKIWAYTQTQSATVLSSLLDSGSDVLVSLMTWASLYYSTRPPDEDHRFGHGKMEGISALIQGVLLSIGAMILLYEGFYRLIVPQPVQNPAIGVGVLVFSLLASCLLVQAQTRIVKRHRSLAIEADRGHYTSDMLMNGSAALVILLVPLTGWIWLDAVFALGVSILMAFVALTIGRKAVDMLLDREVEAAIKHQIARAILSDEKITRLHDLRVIRHGMRLMVTYDLEMDGQISLNMAHAIAVASEDRILSHFPHAEVMTHMDPVGSTHSQRHHVMDVISTDSLTQTEVHQIQG